jgi:hypothetical protein
MDPQQTNIMMSPHDWKNLKLTLYGLDSLLKCEVSSNPLLPECYFPTACSATKGKAVNIKINLGSAGDPISFDMYTDLLKDSEEFDPKTKNGNCYLAIGENNVNPITTTIVIGSVFFEKYYVVFDSSETVNNALGTNNIGYGPINPRNVLGDQIYNVDSAHYDRRLYE